ncbi:MAG: Ig-like domain-containing protein [Lachnospiraceae bacterium]|nr:Ig-like domain-containing protein [Lachnospiraceae bacterium]
MSRKHIKVLMVILGCLICLWALPAAAQVQTDAADSVTAALSPHTAVKTGASKPASSLKLNQTSIIMVKGKTYTLKATAVNISGKRIWGSSRKSVAAVNSNGKVTAQGKGTATITVKIGKKKASCKVKVIAPSLSKTYVTLKKGKSTALKVTGTTSALTWSSSNTAVAAVSSSGKVKAKAEGTAVIKVKIGVHTLKCKVTVTETKWQKLLDQYRNDKKTKQLIFVQYTGGSSADVYLYTKSGTTWKQTLSCSGEVGKNGIDKVREGDKKTPTGTFNLTSAYGIANDPGAKMDYVKINNNLYWCGDELYYNQLVDITKKPHNCYNGEHLIEYTQCYAYGMFLDYNKECIYKKGSAIFLHCKGNSGYTAGCIAVSRSNMIKIIRAAEPGAKICIYPK